MDNQGKNGGLEGVWILPWSFVRLNWEELITWLVEIVLVSNQTNVIS